VHERENEGELLLVAVRVLAILPPEIQIEPFGQRLDGGVLDVASQARDVRDDLGATPAAELGELARAVADLSFHGDRVAIAVESEDPRRAAGRMDQSHELPDRRGLARAVRAQETEHLAVRDREIEIEDPSTVAVVLGESLRLDGLCHVRFPFRLRAPSAALSRSRISWMPDAMSFSVARVPVVDAARAPSSRSR